ncbi:MAG: choice-of-anchor D domain-containing protein [Bacteroidota bacterium]|nr:choice-of-anchor D domain-containing protein [Bacteroidota bacterium]
MRNARHFINIGTITQRSGRIFLASGFYWQALAVAMLLSLAASTQAQWRIPTPRDTVTVQANQKTFVTSKIQLTTGVDMWVSPSGTFTENDGTTTFGMDAAYTYLINGTSLIPQVLNPPVYSGKIHKYAFTVTTIPGLNESNFAPLESSFQPGHIYTSRVPSQGNKFQFRILADRDADYPLANGSLNIKMARWTAGISVQTFNVNFGNVFIGTSKTMLDSLASYGLDPLEIDSIKIIDLSGFGDYTFLSERDKSFTLQSEQTNELKINFSPSIRGAISAELHIYSRNADAASRIKIIYLTGFGIAPAFGVGPKQVDFGKVRIGYPATGYTQISNAQVNTTLTVTTNSKYIQYQPAPPPNAFSFAPQTVLPMDITAGSIGQVRTRFSPQAQVKYQATLLLRGNNVPPDSVQFTGEGAQPVPVLSPVAKNGTLDFGIVYNGNSSQQIVTLTNKGNWTASVILARISGPFGPVFSFTPSDTEFILEPDSSRVFTISFHPRVGAFDSLHIFGYFELVYDDFTIDTIKLTGIEIEPKILLSKLVHDFGRVKVGASKIDTVSTLWNKSNITVRLQEEDVLPGFFYKEIGKIGQIDAGKTVPLICKFAPLVAGPATAWAFISANGKLDSVELTGIGAVGKAIFNPTPVNYGIVPSNVAKTLSTTLKDSGDYSLRVIRMEISGRDAADFTIISPSQSPFVPFTIEPDSSVDISVRFITNALTGTVHSATLCVYYDDSTSDCIPLQGIEEAQHLQFGQSSIDFGKHRIKTHTVLPGVFRNGSNILLAAGAETVTSPNNVFTLVDTLRPIRAQSIDSVLVDFFPQVRGLDTGYLHAFGGDIKTDSIQLRGQGAAPMPEFSDSIVDFGIVALGTPKQKSFSLIDTGDWWMKVTNIELRGANTDEFTYQKGGQVSITTDSIGERQYSTYDVTFTPNKTIVFHSARLVFTFDDGTQGTVRLIGYDESPRLVLDDDTVNFGKVRLGTPPAIYTVHIVSTSHDTLSAQNLNLISAAPAGTFTANPNSGPIAVMPRTLYPVDLGFKPQAVGQYNAMFISSGKDVENDTVFIYGIGAAPVTVLSSKVLDFGTLFPGYTASRSFTISNTGNWPLDVTKIEIIGPNKADFTLRNTPPQFSIAEDSTSPFTVDFLAATPYQPAQRTAQIVFTLDDGSTFTVDLIEQDIAPIQVDLRMDQCRARIGDIVYPCLRLKTELPDSLHILDLKGVITYDATLFDIDRTGCIRGDALVQLGGWSLITDPTDLPGTYTYELKGTTAPLTKTGPVLRMQFKPHDNDAPGATSPLVHKQFSFPLRTELAPQMIDGVLIVDSACGDTHILYGPATANMVDQNMPNPFGTTIGQSYTQIPFDIGFDNTPVTIRILDITGKEVARPLDNVLFKQGRYTAKVSASQLGSNGTFFYEFRAGDAKPVFKKMVVSR